MPCLSRFASSLAASNSILTAVIVPTIKTSVKTDGGRLLRFAEGLFPVERPTSPARASLKRSRLTLLAMTTVISRACAAAHLIAAGEHAVGELVLRLAQRMAG